MGNISKKIENFLKDINKLKDLIFYCATIRDKKSKGVKVKGKGEELKRVSRTWREFKAQKISSEKGKYVKVPAGATAKVPLEVDIPIGESVLCESGINKVDTNGDGYGGVAHNIKKK